MTVHLMLSAGRGPIECSWAVARLLPRLEADAKRHGVRSEHVSSVAGDRAGTLRSAVIRLSGDDAGTFAAGWTGTLCWQAPSPFRSTSRKNWYVIAQPCELDTQRTPFSESDVDIVGVRTGGPGGQHRNKASTAVRATHRPSGLVVVVDTERQFTLNRSLALRQLRDRLQRTDQATARAAETTRWQIHDDLIRGNPVRTERP
ncbi:peptide chain release factor H [Actinoplanes sp. NPDC049596]|uniref:peptide chain release factor H n=1 Tax=unclassified Actinoplanes TaxID=2626549 RepID=UPI003447CCCE